MHKTYHTLPLPVRETSCTLLNARLAETIDLYLQTKQAHWNVKGPQFIALHELLDDSAALVLGYVDQIAERVVQLGGTAEGTLQAVAGRSPLKAYPLTLVEGLAHIEAVCQNWAAVSTAIRKGIDETDAAGDAVTADLLTQAAGGLDKQLWFLEAHLQASR